MNKLLSTGAALHATLDAKDFLRRHGDSLTELLDVIAGSYGVDAYCAADRLLDHLNPNPVRVGRALRKLHELLAEADDLEGRLAGSLRWHGARLHDLAARLPG